MAPTCGFAMVNVRCIRRIAVASTMSRGCTTGWTNTIGCPTTIVRLTRKAQMALRVQFRERAFAD
jgi:hypothetical protein